VSKANLKTGAFGEEMAVEYLKENGFDIHERNWRTGHKEIDIIAQEGATTVFVEVKTRRSTKYGLPEEGLSDRQMESLIDAADEYLHEHPNLNIRFDLIAILLKGSEIEDLFHSKDIYL